MEYSVAQVERWISSDVEPDYTQVNKIVDDYFASAGIATAGTFWDRLYEFLMRNSTAFTEFVDKNQHGIEAAALIALVLTDLHANHVLRAEHGQAAAMAILKLVLQLKGK